MGRLHDWYSFESKADPKNWGEQKAFFELGLDKDYETLSKTPNWNISFIKK